MSGGFGTRLGSGGDGGGGGDLAWHDAICGSGGRAVAHGMEGMVVVRRRRRRHGVGGAASVARHGSMVVGCMAGERRLLGGVDRALGRDLVHAGGGAGVL